MSNKRLSDARDPYPTAAYQAYQEEEERRKLVKENDQASNRFLRSEVSAWKRVVAALIRQIERNGGRARMTDLEKYAETPVISSQYNPTHRDTVFYLPKEQPPCQP